MSDSSCRSTTWIRLPHGSRKSQRKPSMSSRPYLPVSFSRTSAICPSSRTMPLKLPRLPRRLLSRQGTLRPSLQVAFRAVQPVLHRRVRILVVDKSLSSIDVVDLRERVAAGEAINLRELAVYTGYSYSVVREWK